MKLSYSVTFDLKLSEKNYIKIFNFKTLKFEDILEKKIYTIYYKINILVE